MEWVMNEENDWDHNTVGGSVECVGREDVVQALNEIKQNLRRPLNLQMYHLKVHSRQFGNYS